VKHYCDDPYCELCNPPQALEIFFVPGDALLEFLQGYPNQTVAAQQEVETLERWYNLEAK